MDVPCTAAAAVQAFGRSGSRSISKLISLTSDDKNGYGIIKTYPPESTFAEGTGYPFHYNLFEPDAEVKRGLCCLRNNKPKLIHTKVYINIIEGTFEISEAGSQNYQAETLLKNSIAIIRATQEHKVRLRFIGDGLGYITVGCARGDRTFKFLNADDVLKLLEEESKDKGD